MGCVLALPACMLAGCDDRLEVRQAYDFSLSSWYLQEGIEPDEIHHISGHPLLSDYQQSAE